MESWGTQIMNFFYLYCIKCKNGVEECLNKVDEIADAQTSRSVSHLEHLLRKNERLQDTQIHARRGRERGRFWKRKKLQGSQMHALTQKRFEGLEEDEIAGFSNNAGRPC